MLPRNALHILKGGIMIGIIIDVIVFVGACIFLGALTWMIFEFAEDKIRKVRKLIRRKYESKKNNNT